MIHDTQSAKISQKKDEHNIYVIMKTMCPLDYHHNGFVAIHVYGYTLVVLAGTKEPKSVQEGSDNYPQNSPKTVMMGTSAYKG